MTKEQIDKVEKALIRHIEEVTSVHTGVAAASGANIYATIAPVTHALIALQEVIAEPSQT
jgi:hypothetical protein